MRSDILFSFEFLFSFFRKHFLSLRQHDLFLAQIDVSLEAIRAKDLDKVVVGHTRPREDGLADALGVREAVVGDVGEGFLQGLLYERARCRL